MKANKWKTKSFILGTAAMAAMVGVMGLSACHGESAPEAMVGEGRIKLTTAARVLVTPDSDVLRREPLAGALLTVATIQVLAIDIHAVDDGWYRFQIDPFELDLLNLNQQFTEVLGRATADEGFYDQIRLITAETGFAAFEDGSEAQLLVPSGTKTGIKVMLEPALRIVEGQLSIAGIAFDVNKSFVFPETGVVFFKPVLKVVGQTMVEFPPEDSTTDPGTTDPGTGDTGTGDTTTEGGIGDTGTGSVSFPTDPEDSDPISFPPVFGV